MKVNGYKLVEKKKTKGRESFPVSIGVLFAVLDEPVLAEIATGEVPAAADLVRAAETANSDSDGLGNALSGADHGPTFPFGTGFRLLLLDLACLEVFPGRLEILALALAVVVEFRQEVQLDVEIFIDA